MVTAIARTIAKTNTSLSGFGAVSLLAMSLLWRQINVLCRM
jgi:hypothetical protein